MVSQAQLEAAMRAEAGDLSQALISAGAIREPELLKFLGLYFQTRYVTTEKLSAAKIPQWVLDLVPLEVCERHLAIPVRCDSEMSELSVVCTDPSAAELRSEIQRVSGVKQVHAYVGLRHAIEAAIRRSYRGDIHAFARIDQSLRQDFSELMNIYEQRLIDLEQDGSTSAPASLADLQAHEPGNQEARMEVTHEPAAADLTPGGQLAAASGRGGRSGGESLDALCRTRPDSTSALPAVSGARTLDLDGFVQVVSVLINLLEYSEGWRQGHSLEVARLAVQVGERLDLDEPALVHLRLAALLHDLGKPADPHLTLLSTEVSAESRTLARKVYLTPCKLLEMARLPDDLARILLTLYERPDGNGIPGRSFGRELPLGARIIAAVDAYCDLAANPRAPGGRAEDPEAAMQRLRDAAQRQLLDHDVTDALGRVILEAHRERGAGYHVLVIDAEVGSNAVLEQKLAALGYEVRLVRTTAEAALVVLSEKVDLILSEVHLEPVDGFVFLERLRSDPRTQSLPLIFVSDRAEVEDVNRGFELGALDYIVKPFAPEVLVAKIRRVLEQPGQRR